MPDLCGIQQVLVKPVLKFRELLLDFTCTLFCLAREGNPSKSEVTEGIVNDLHAYCIVRSTLTPTRK